MALHLYFRASTDSQDFMQQQNCVNTYLTQHGIDPDKDITKTVVEKVSGTVKHTERKLAGLLAKCSQGDKIFISELSRLGRNMSDLFAIVTEACEKGVTIVQCKDGSTIENESIGGKALLFALSLAAEIEVANTRQRTQMALDARKKLLETDGVFISKSGKECRRLGRPKRNGNEPYDLSGVEASCRAKQDAAILWREQSAAYKMVREWNAMGKSRNDMLAELQKLYEHAPEKFGTPNGRCVTRSVLDRWCREMNPLAV